MLTNLLVKPGVLELKEIKTLKPSCGEILVKIKAALTYGTDLKAFRRGHPIIPMPTVFGHEFSGVIEKVLDVFKLTAKAKDSLKVIVII
jgi:L-iditol 2-dehydrogenase